MEQNAHTAALIATLSEVGRSAVDRGLVLASGGNLSARLPGGDTFVVTSAGARLNQLTSEDFSIMTLDGRIIAGSPKPSSEWRLHQLSYQVRPDVNSVVHLHPQHAVLLEALGYPIRLITLDHAYYVKSVGTTPYYPNGSDELAESAASQAHQHDCIVMANHGCSTLGASIEMAYQRALLLEEAATATYRALLLGDTSTALPPEVVAALRHA
jgi:L-fuculose-phosphate aldolase